jgi:hypothetical protein
VECDEYSVMDFIIFVLFKFRPKLLATNNLMIRERTKFVTERESSKFLLDDMTVVSSANNSREQKVFFECSVPV